jgi:tetratricopeptide (TPR) repeat protein
MSNTYHTQAQFYDSFGKEMASAVSVYTQRRKSGMKENSLAVYDFIFISDTEKKLRLLGDFLDENYNYKIKAITAHKEYYELSGDSTEFPVDEDNLLFWALDLYCKGYEFDCRLDGYGAVGDSKNQKFPPMNIESYEQYFDLAMSAYDNRNLGMAFIHLSTAIKIDPNNPNCWYSRAIMKDELHTWKSARRDYDKAIELAPDFTNAIVNRAANKDEAGEFAEAIIDYTTVIGLEPENKMAYFNRGNSWFNLNDSKSACEDWHVAKSLGAEYAQQRIDKNCNKIIKKL